MNDNLDELEENAEKIHQYYHNFLEFLDENGRDLDDLAGFEDQELVESYASEHPEIKIVGVDDNDFCSSDLVLIPHPTMGITALFIPQCTTIQNRFFMYPGHIFSLEKAITELKEYLEEN